MVLWGITKDASSWPFNSILSKGDYVVTLLETNNKHANVSLLSLVANNMEQQLEKFSSRELSLFLGGGSGIWRVVSLVLSLRGTCSTCWRCWFVFVSFSHRLDSLCVQWVAASQRESPLRRRSWPETWTLSSPVRSAITRSHVMSKCTGNTPNARLALSLIHWFIRWSMPNVFITIFSTGREPEILESYHAQSAWRSSRPLLPVSLLLHEF